MTTGTHENGESAVRRTRRFLPLPLLSAVTPFLLLPILARVATESEWTAVVVGQSIGSIGVILVALGWNLNGPSLVAALKPADRVDLYVESLVTRIVVYAIAVPFVALATVLLERQSSAIYLALTSAIAFTSYGLSASWYNIGVGSAADIAKYDAIPKMIATALAAIVLYLTHLVFIYPALLLAANLLGVALFTRRLVSEDFVRKARAISLVSSIRKQTTSLGTLLAGGAYSSGSTALVRIGSDTSSVAVFAAGDRLYSMGLQAVVALSNALQGWVMTSSGPSAPNMRAAVRAHLVLGALAFAVLLGLGPFITRTLFGTSLEVPAPVIAWFAVAYLFVSLNTSIGRHVLVPLGCVRGVFVSTLAGAIVGVPSLIILGGAANASGAAAAVALSQFTVLFTQLVFLRHLREHARASMTAQPALTGGRHA